MEWSTAGEIGLHARAVTSPRLRRRADDDAAAAGAQRSRREIEQLQQLPGGHAFDAGAQHDTGQVARRDGLQVARDVVEPDVDAAPPRRIDRVDARIDAVRVDAALADRGEERAVTGLEHGHAARQFRQRVDDVGAPQVVVALGLDAGHLESRPFQITRQRLEIGDFLDQRPQHVVHGDAETHHLLRDELVVPAEQPRHDALHQTEGGVVRRDGDLGVDPRGVLGAFQGVGEVLGHLGGSESREERVELTFERGRVLTRGATRAHLGGDFVADLHHVDDVFVVDGVLAHARVSSFSAQQASVRFGLIPESAVS
jgi:hypothetical protein